MVAHPQTDMAAPPNSPSLVTTVPSLHDAFRWVEHNLAVIAGHSRSSLRSIAKSLQQTTMSSSFSGIGAPENASHSICKGLAHFLGEEVAPRNLWACEYYNHSQHELCMLPDSPPCLFGDITEFISFGVRDDLKANASRMTYDDLIQLFFDVHTKSPTSLVGLSGFCLKHKRMCSLSQAVLHVAGTPCIAWSRLGLRCGAKGATALAFFVWITHRLLLQEDAILHENVPEFEAQLLEALLGHIYIITSCVLKNSELGQLVDRDRRYTWLLHKRIINQNTPIPEPWGPTFISRFHRGLQTTCAEFWDLASADEIEYELQWSCNRKGSRAHGCVETPVDFQDTFTEWEHEAFLRYVTIVGPLRDAGKFCVASLHQNPAADFATHNYGRALLHTVTRHTFPQFAWGPNRWLTPLETLTTNTLVTYPQLSQFGEKTSFCFRREDFGLPPRTRSAPKESNIQSGLRIHTKYLRLCIQTKCP
jgi:hypothetical protein